MQRVYLILTVIGFAVPGTFTVMESVETGNILFWTDPARTISELFVNRTSTTFALDLAGAAVVALVWMVQEGRTLGMKRLWGFVVLTLLFGLAGTLPLFLYLRERRKAIAQPSAAGAPAREIR